MILGPFPFEKKRPVQCSGLASAGSEQLDYIIPLGLGELIACGLSVLVAVIYCKLIMVVLVHVRWCFLAELPCHGWSKEALAGHKVL